MRVGDRAGILLCRRVNRVGDSVRTAPLGSAPTGPDFRQVGDRPVLIRSTADLGTVEQLAALLTPAGLIARFQLHPHSELGTQSDEGLGLDGVAGNESEFPLLCERSQQ